MSFFRLSSKLRCSISFLSIGNPFGHGSMWQLNRFHKIFSMSTTFSTSTGLPAMHLCEAVVDKDLICNQRTFIIIYVAMGFVGKSGKDVFVCVCVCVCACVCVCVYMYVCVCVHV